VRVALIGAGAVGARAARQLVSTSTVETVLITDLDRDRARTVVEQEDER
jgi:saccharopine dehydrogenase-like NADP-dependent oxidoreductase